MRKVYGRVKKALLTIFGDSGENTHAKVSIRVGVWSWTDDVGTGGDIECSTAESYGHIYVRLAWYYHLHVDQ